MSTQKEAFMRLALAEAARGLGRTSPNPPVGAVVVRDGQVVGVGHHARAGSAHAEAEALRAAGAAAKGADIYITLEPCDHHGKMPPCAPAIVAAGVSRAFIGTIDPNPKVSGRGVRRLEQAGIAVEVGTLEADCRQLIEPWAKFIETRTPYVVAKVASTLDGRIATKAGASQWITGEAARRKVHELRSVHDAVLVGRGTALADDPRLTSRIPGGRDPIRIVLDTGLALPPSAQILAQPGRTFIACGSSADEGKAAALREAGAEILRCRQVESGKVDLDDLLGKLGGMGIVSLLVEGGAEVFESFLGKGRVDSLLLFYGPKIFGDGPAWIAGPAAEKVEDALGFQLRSVHQVGEDALLELQPTRSGCAAT